MLASDAQNLKPGDVIFVRMRVAAPAVGPDTMGNARGWINVENITDTDFLGSQEIIVSCSDAVTPADLKAWKEKP